MINKYHGNGNGNGDGWVMVKEDEGDMGFHAFREGEKVLEGALYFIFT
jgi:hypothetical protein